MGGNERAKATSERIELGGLVGLRRAGIDRLPDIHTTSTLEARNVSGGSAFVGSIWLRSIVGKGKPVGEEDQKAYPAGVHGGKARVDRLRCRNGQLDRPLCYCRIRAAS